VLVLRVILRTKYTCSYSAKSLVVHNLNRGFLNSSNSTVPYSDDFQVLEEQVVMTIEVRNVKK
jgi:hypothetical protein